MNDHDLPIAQSFVELIEGAKNNELVQIEEHRKAERAQAAALRRAAGTLNASELLMGSDEEQEDLKLKAQVLGSLDQLNKDVAEAMKKREQQNVTLEEDNFPDPPTT